MRSFKAVIAVTLVVSMSTWAQTETNVTPPPMVPANPPPPPPLEPTQPAQPGTPPPPSTVPPAGYQPNQPYSPYGQPQLQEKPGPEIGLMVSESLFGMLTSAGITLLPWFLLFGSGQGALTGTVADVILILLFGTVPLAVAQTQISLANGSRYYNAEMWPSLLAGLGTQAAIVGIFYATGGLRSTISPGVEGSAAFLLISSIAVVPLVQMAVLNLVKQPKFKLRAMGSTKPGEGVTLGIPAASPIIAETRNGRSLGVNLSVLNGTF